MRNSPSERDSSRRKPNALHVVAAYIAMSGGALMTHINPPSVQGQEYGNTAYTVAKEDSDATQRIHTLCDDTFCELYGSMPKLVADGYATREKTQAHAFRKARDLLTRMHPLPHNEQMELDAILSEQSESPEMRHQKRWIKGLLRECGVISTTRIPLTPTSTSKNVLQMLESQTGVKLKFPDGWDGLEDIVCDLREGQSVSFSQLLHRVCHKGNFVPVLESNGMTVAFTDNTHDAIVFIHENILCVLHSRKNSHLLSEELELFSDPQQNIAWLNTATFGQPHNIDVTACFPGRRNMINTIDFTQSATITSQEKCHEDPDESLPYPRQRMVNIDAALPTDRVTVEIPLDGTHTHLGIQSISATCQENSINIVWESRLSEDDSIACMSPILLLEDQFIPVNVAGDVINNASSPVVRSRISPQKYNMTVQCMEKPHSLYVRGAPNFSPDGEGANIVIKLPARK